MILNDFKNKIINIINTSELSAEAIYYVMKDIMYDITNQYNALLQQEAATQAYSKEEPQMVETESVAVVENQEEE